MSACSLMVGSTIRQIAKAAVIKRCVAVAYSGGRDSTALLHATATNGVKDGFDVVALHVHHGLSKFADAWLAHGAEQCAAWAIDGLPVRFVSHRLKAIPAKGASVEAWARQARYRALRAMAVEQGADIVLLAHHRRDQAETLLLQALRGGGTAALSGMPTQVLRDGITWARPWLTLPREAIDHYVEFHGLSHIEDDSNTDTRFARNRLRLEVWPALSQAFPQAEAAFADSATWAQEATACLRDLAAIDLAFIADAQGLHTAAWSELSCARRSNALRAWLAAQMGSAAEATLIERLMHELPGSGSALWDASRGALKRYRGVLTFHAEVKSAVVASTPETTLRVNRAGIYRLPGWGGSLVATRVKQDGVALAWLGHVELRARQGAEQFQAGLMRPARSLKKQFQAAGVAAWHRDGPLLFSGGQLVFVPGLGVDARVVALPGQPQVALLWEPDQRT
jgi:tRNA(Ile)-lysidine synthase